MHGKVLSLEKLSISKTTGFSFRHGRRIRFQLTFRAEK